MGGVQLQFLCSSKQARHSPSEYTTQLNTGWLFKKNRERPEAGQSIKRGQEAMEDKNDRDLLL